MRYKDRTHKPVCLLKFTDDCGTSWTATASEGSKVGSHLISRGTRSQVIAAVDESDWLRFDEISILGYRFTELYRPCTFDRKPFRHLDYGESISFESEELKGWIARIEAKRLSVLVHNHNQWINHPDRDNLPLFWREHCQVNLPLPQTEAEYLELVAQIAAKT
jgi:hypothetical protein